MIVFRPCYLFLLWNVLKCLALCLIAIIAACFLYLYACLTCSSVHASSLHPLLLAHHHLCYVDVYCVFFIFAIRYISLWLHFGLFVYIFLSDWFLCLSIILSVLFSFCCVCFLMLIFTIHSHYFYCLPNPRSFYKIHCSLSCAVLPCALVKYLVNRMAYDEREYRVVSCSTFKHCLKPLRPVNKKKKLHKTGQLITFSSLIKKN